MKVENKRTYRGPGVYIGRPSKYGNPYKVHRESWGRDRATAIEKFETYARQRLIREPAWLDDLRGSDVLVCWCAPLPCHGDVLVRLLDEFDTN